MRRSLPPTAKPLHCTASTSTTTRRQLCSASVVVALGLTSLPANSAVSKTETKKTETYTDSDGSFQFDYPADWKVVAKPVKTHLREVEVKRGKVSVGVAVDPVKLKSLESFGDPEFVGEKVVGVEKRKTDIYSAELLSASSVTDGNTFYVLEYAVTGDRGDNHFLAKVAVENGYLFVMTTKSSAEEWPTVRDELQQIVGTFEVNV